MNILLPQKPGMDKKKNERFPVLYLLHGIPGDYSNWLRKTSIERYAEAKDIAVVMPDAHRSFYTDMKYGYKYGTFISGELPEIVQSLFPVSGKREKTFVAGLSAGGYGAFRLALGCPDRYAAAASLSGALDVVSLMAGKPNFEYEMVFGDTAKLKGSNADLFYLAEKMASSGKKKPMLYQCCGTEDFLYQDNVHFRDFCRKLPLGLTYEEEHGSHGWGYWDMKIQRVLDWLPL